MTLEIPEINAKEGTNDPKPTAGSVYNYTGTVVGTGC